MLVITLQGDISIICGHNILSSLSLTKRSNNACAIAILSGVNSITTCIPLYLSRKWKRFYN